MDVARRVQPVTDKSIGTFIISHSKNGVCCPLLALFVNTEKKNEQRASLYSLFVLIERNSQICLNNQYTLR